MRAYELTPAYRHGPPHEAPSGPLEWSDAPRWLLELDEYEVVNLQRLLDAVAGKTGERDVPVAAFNNGDWVGQIGFYLPKTTGRVHPNRPYPDAARLSVARPEEDT